VTHPASRIPTHLASRIPRLTLAMLLSVLACTKPGADVIALEGATLIDGSGGDPVKDALILVKNGRIQAVARVNEISVPRGAQTINLIGKTVIPGLIDAHAHVERWACERYVAWGVTAVRDLGAGSTDSTVALRSELNLGSVLGPRMYTAGAMIDGTPPTHALATGVATGGDARRAVDQRAVAGTDLVKVFTKVTPQMLEPLLDEAKMLRLSVAAHLGKTDAVTAARAGVGSLEHMAGVVQAAAPNPDPYLRAHDRFVAGWTLEELGWATLDSAAIAGVARALAAARVAVVPTLVLHDMLSRLDNPTLDSRPGMDDVPVGAASVRDVPGLLRRTGWRAADFQAFRRSRARQHQFLREFKRAGGLIAAGSDAASELLVPGLSLHEEMSLLVAAGLKPLEAITAATRKGAELLRADSLGMIAPGKLADLVVLDANPAVDINATRRIAWVMVRGRIVQPDSLRKTWGRSGDGQTD
jgi:imidazolonepropionase-like amidohydrolase